MSSRRPDAVIVVPTLPNDSSSPSVARWSRPSTSRIPTTESSIVCSARDSNIAWRNTPRPTRTVARPHASTSSRVSPSRPPAATSSRSVPNGRTSASSS
ncbi:MAG: hypothetical protein NT062_27010 [Proteobacteria bacterium]|nr:hypothetical protein [Pseudomonadota bacterium]